MKRSFVTALLALAALAPPASAAVRMLQMVVFRDGGARTSSPTAAQTTAKVGAERCAVAAATPLAALIRSGVGPLSLRNYGSCSKRPADGGGAFVAGIGGDHNRGSDGWVYKAGNVPGTAGAADPSGPLGRGRLRSGAHVTWFWCHVSARDNGCPHTLVASASGGKSSLRVTVRQYDDHGKERLAAG